MIKYWIPTILTVVLLSEFREKSYNPYGGYPWGYLSVGIIWFSLMVVVVALVAIFPQWMTQKADEAAFESVPLSDVGNGRSNDANAVDPEAVDAEEAAAVEAVMDGQATEAEKENFVD